MSKSHLLLSLLLTLLSLTTAEIKTVKITSDSRPMILFQKFGFSSHTGRVSISVSVSASSFLSSPDPSRLGFFLVSDESFTQVRLELQQNPSFCVIDSYFINLLFTFRDLSSPPNSSFNQNFPVTFPGEYSLFFANCAPESQEVTMDVRTELYNLDSDTSKDSLSSGLTQLPSLYFLFFLVYLSFLGFWFSYYYQNKRSVHWIHLLMTLLVLIKDLNLICVAEYKHYVKVIGTSHGWNILFYALFQFNRVLVLSMLIVLIGTGWSFSEPSLRGQGGKMALMIVIPLQVLGNMASIVIGETGPFREDWVTWNQVFVLVDIVCCYAIIFSIRWPWRSNNDWKFSLFRRFNIVVIGYFFYTIVFGRMMIAGYKYKWVAYAAEEIGSLTFYVVMFYMFRSVVQNEDFVVDAEAAKEAAEIAVRDPPVKALSGNGIFFGKKYSLQHDEPLQ